ncbi:hypothetical protein KAU09_01305 [Candidatus Parcubacteria bacterium]|nr:hypothetical protein [Candidatus Parcubacteria bacterium]
MRINFARKRETKKKMRFWGFIVGGLGLFIILDSWTIFPIPLAGPLAWYVGSFLLIPSAIAVFYTYQEPSDREISQLAVKTNGYILATFLVDAFDIASDMAEGIMKRLFLEGYLDIVNKIDNETPISQWVTLFVGAGQRSTNKEAIRERSQNMNLAEHTADNLEMSVADINDMLLNGDLSLGGSGQPQR